VTLDARAGGQYLRQERLDPHVRALDLRRVRLGTYRLSFNYPPRSLATTPVVGFSRLTG
jgi:hypothetical protein